VTGRVVEKVRVTAPPVLPAAVSIALAPIVDTGPHPAAVLGVADPAVWIRGADGVLMVSTIDAVRLPNSAVVAVPVSDRPFRAIRPGDDVSVGDGAIVFASLRVEAARWFDPLPAIPVSDAGAVSRVVASLDAVVPSMPDHGLEETLSKDDDLAAVEAAKLLIGSGDGLTPRGDDLIAGMISATMLMARSLGVASAGAMVQRLQKPFLDLAATATTSLSATLLGHAFRGEVAEPAAALLLALAGRGDAVEAAEALNEVGHSSGPALAAGVLAGAMAVIERSS